MRVGICAIFLALASAASMSAAPRTVELSIQDGRVWLVARDATVAQILAEWARVGQTTITNADRVPSERMTLELRDVPERQALDLLLRSASGFVATTRTAAVGYSGAQSQFERIVIVAASNAPANTPAPLNAGRNTAPAMPPQPYAVPVAPGVHRIIGADGQPVPDDQDDAPVPASQPPRPLPGSMPPGFSAPPQTAPPPQPASATPATNVPRAAPGTPVPGMIVAPPTQPSQPVRPPR